MWILPKQLHTSAFALDTAALSLDLNESSQLCAASLFVRSSPSLLRTWSLKWKRDSWTQHLFGRILKPSLGKAFETAWTSSLGATHASHSVQPASDLEVKTPGIFGRISQEAFQFFNQESASLKTSRATLPVGCITFCATWEDWVTERRGAYSQRLNAVRHTSESECSSLQWPTTAARDWKGCGNAVDRKDGKHRLDTLEAVVMHGHPAPASSSTDGSRPGLLTPQVQDSKHSGANLTENGDRDLLVNQVNWPTATVSTGAHRQKDVSMTDKLDQQVKTWATPQSRDAKGAEGRMIREGHCSDLPSQTEVAPTGQWNRSNGKLNSRWVEILMNLPVGWTMPSCASPVTIAPIAELVVSVGGNWPTASTMDAITPTRDLLSMESKGHWGKKPRSRANGIGFTAPNTGKLSEMVNYIQTSTSPVTIAPMNCASSETESYQQPPL